MKIPINQIMHGDCLEHLKELPENSIDAIITDPPYGLEFMGKEWDSFKEKGQGDGWQKAGKPSMEKFEGKNDWHSKPRPAFRGHTLEHWKNMQQHFFEVGLEAIRVLKPGGFMLIMGGTRTYHRMTCGIEDAGFEIRDCIMWLYGSGFPKSLNIGKQIDKLQGNEREVVGILGDGANRKNSPFNTDEGWNSNNLLPPGNLSLTKGNSEWEGWGTALKPACEPIVVARKPLSEKNVALNVLKWGTGGINIDASRIGTEERQYKGAGSSPQKLDNHTKGSTGIGMLDGSGKDMEFSVQGRFPANIILDEEAGKMLDEQSGERKTGGSGKLGTFRKAESPIEFTSQRYVTEKQFMPSSTGGASRFFYCAKASKSERNLGCEDLESKRGGSMDANTTDRMQLGGASLKGEHKEIQSTKNNHPTVKPLKLMEYLIKLVTKEGAIVLDPFLGSGTTAIACVKLNRNWIGIEKEEEYIKIAQARLKPHLEQRKLI